MDGPVVTNEQAALLAAAYVRAQSGYASETIVATAETFLTWLDSHTRQPPPRDTDWVGTHR